MAHGQPLVAQGYTAITPAVAFSKPWMQSFLKACNGCNVRIIIIHTSSTSLYIGFNNCFGQFAHMAAHIYATDSQSVIDYLTDLHNTFGMSIWVTEFACHVRFLSPPSHFSQLIE